MAAASSSLLSPLSSLFSPRALAWRGGAGALLVVAAYACLIVLILRLALGGLGAATAAGPAWRAARVTMPWALPGAVTEALTSGPEAGGYQVLEFPAFLTREECARLIARAARAKMEPSRVYGASEDVLDGSTRASEQAWLRDGDDPLVLSVSRKVAALTRLPLEHQEPLQVVRYATGGSFTPHYDPCTLEGDGCKRMDGASGPRLYTVLIYLNDDYEGGETVFPNAGVTVRPEAGKAILFQSTTLAEHSLIADSLHAGQEVTRGDKWICNKWVRAAPFG
jgi:predicted 2-oxoglutarate/Fe(II)-dependent dioxygenase YbiX